MRIYKEVLEISPFFPLKRIVNLDWSKSGTCYAEIAVEMLYLGGSSLLWRRKMEDEVHWFIVLLSTGALSQFHFVEDEERERERNFEFYVHFYTKRDESFKVFFENWLRSGTGTGI